VIAGFAAARLPGARQDPAIWFVGDPSVTGLAPKDSTRLFQMNALFQSHVIGPVPVSE